MIVTLNDQRLWVEGEKAYSIDEVKSRHEELLAIKSDLESNIKYESEEIANHEAEKAKYDQQLKDTNYELEGNTFVLNKILDAEKLENAEVVNNDEIENEIVEDSEKSEEVDEDEVGDVGLVVDPDKIPEPTEPVRISPKRNVKVIF